MVKNLILSRILLTIVGKQNRLSELMNQRAILRENTDSGGRTISPILDPYSIIENLDHLLAAVQ
jgi:hypothetical protein